MRRRLLSALFLLTIAAPAAAQTMPNRERVLIDLRNAYPARITQAQAGELLARLAFALRAEGFGLLRKSGGNSCPAPGVGPVSCDILLHRPSSTWCDVLGDTPDEQGPGNATPTWCPGTPGDMTGFVAVTVDPGGGGPVDPPTPPSDTITKAQLEAAIATAVAQVRREIVAVRSEIDGRFASLPNAVSEDRVAELIAEAFGRAVVSGSTGRTLGHTHSISVTLRPR